MHTRFFVFLFCFLFSTLSAENNIVVTVGEPIIDLIYTIDDSLLENLQLKKGGSLKVNYEEFQLLLAQLAPKNPKIVPGGSAANTIKGLAKLGQNTRFIGKIGRDERGQQFTEGLKHYAVNTHLILSDTHTTQALSLVTPDGQRTLRCCFGASCDLSSDELDREDFQSIKHLHLEGYLFYNEAVLMRTLQLAKEAGATISIDLASFELVQRFQEKLKHILKEYVDIVFANRDEAKALTGLEPEQACWELQKLCPIAVVLIGKEGSWFGSNFKLRKISSFPVHAIDTTGAGDLYISGFLHGFLEGYPLEQCALFGNLTGAICVTAMGAEIPDEEWDKLRLLMPKNYD